MANKLHDYYKVLGLNHNSTSEEIKKAYRQKAKIFHPDVNASSNAGEDFRIITEAYETLSDVDKRRAYDTQDFVNSTYVNSTYINFNTEPLRVNSDLDFAFDFDVERLFYDNSIEIKYMANIACEDCQGSGGDESILCPGCNGLGCIIYNYNFNKLEAANMAVCGFCHGRGKKLVTVCQACEGFGFKKIERSVLITDVLFAAFKKMKLYGKGNSDINNSQPPGNLYLTANLIIQNGYIDHNNLNCIINYPIDILNCITENTIYVTGLNKERHTIHLKQNIFEYTISCKGIPVKKERTDLIVHLQPYMQPIKDTEIKEKIVQYLNITL